MTATAFTGGRILTMDPARRSPEVVVVEADRIVAVGDRSLLDAHPGATPVDLAGATLAPGFIDAHNHLSIAALDPRFRDVSRAATTEELLAAVRAQAEAEPEAEWVRVIGWNETATGLRPTRAELDSLGLDRPVVLVHYTLHQCLVSSLGLDRLGIGRGTPDPPGGEIERDRQGEPTGVLLERAWSLAHARSLAPYTDPDRWAEHIAARARVLHRYGITAVHDAACSPEAEAVYRAMADAHELPVSVLAMPHAAELLMNGVGPRLDGPRTGEGDEWLRTGAVKCFADGGASIAIDVTVDGHRLRFGIRMEDLAEHARAAVTAGFRIGVHAMGNEGVRSCIDAFRDAARARPADDHRFRIEHAGLASPAQCRELASIGAVAVVQPGFVDHVAHATGGAEFEGCAWLPFRDLAEAGVALAGSSDDPCAPVAPLWGSARGATRLAVDGTPLAPDQSVPFEDWLHAYTAGAAFAGGQEHERGRLAPGLRADLVVLRGTGTEWTVAETWVAGARVHAAAGPD